MAADMPRNSQQFANGVIEGPSCGVHVNRPRAWGVARKKCQCSARPSTSGSLRMELGAEGMGMDVLHVDCDTCVARGIACSDCVVTVLLGTSGGVVDLDPDRKSTRLNSSH